MRMNSGYICADRLVLARRLYSSGFRDEMCDLVYHGQQVHDEVTVRPVWSRRFEPPF